MLLAALSAACLAVPVTAQNLLGARTFVAQLYIKKTNDRHFRFASARILTAALFDLTQDGGAGLDYDPLCQCRSNDGLSAQILSVTGGDDRAVARLLLRFDADHAAPPQRLSLILSRTPLVGWKIADVQSARIPSLKAWLEQRRRGAGRAAGIARAR
jgi:hypothetical protein